MDQTLPVTCLPNLRTGRKYRLGVSEGEKIWEWWWGTRDDVLVDDDAKPADKAKPSEGDVPIDICVDPIDFEVKEP